jgi:hypothetical protein
MSTQHIDIARWISDNWVWVLILIWVFGGGIAEWVHVQARRHRKAVERRRQYRLRMAYARHGMPYIQAGGQITGIASTGHGTVNVQGATQPGDDLALPAAVIPAPPGARPLHGVPGACRHERIVPVITDGGEVRKWICANWTRGCAAEFPPEIAVYEGDLGEPAEGS